MLHAEVGPAVEWADRALPLAERLDMIPEIADLLEHAGHRARLRGAGAEGVAGLRGVLDLGTAYGLSYAATRARINLSSILSFDDPATGLQIALAGFEEVKRSGDRAQMVVMGVNSVGNALRVGEWSSAGV